MFISFHKKTIVSAMLFLALLSCVDQIEYDRVNNINIIVVDGIITDRDEEQIIKINRSKSEYGQSSTIPISSAIVELEVNSTEIIVFKEKEGKPGEYALPLTFKGKVGASYQLRFQLTDGTKYESTIQIMPKVPPIEKLTARFDANESFAKEGGFKGVHSLYLDVKDPADQANFYSWDYTLYEKKKWCHTCENGVYAINEIIPGEYPFSRYYLSGTKPFENCLTQVEPNTRGAPAYVATKWKYDYECRGECWEILQNNVLNLFEDRNTNGGSILDRKVARIPYYQCNGALVEVRQSSLTKDAYQYFRLFQEQTQGNGGIADTPPSALAGNISNVGNAREIVVGYFTASSVATVRYWLDRKDTGKLEPSGLFTALNQRYPNPEPNPPELAYILIWDGPPRVPKALCLETDISTSHRPEGWVDQVVDPNDPNCKK
ncbi:DUF4249 domain-containing protein [Emticicia fontis]